MEILGDDEARAARPPADGAARADPGRGRNGRDAGGLDVDLDLGLTSEPGADTADQDGDGVPADVVTGAPDQESEGPLGARALLEPFRIVWSPEALALAGLAVHLAAIIGFPNPISWSFAVLEAEATTQRSIAATYATSTTVLAALGTALGVTAVLRLGRAPSRAAAGLAGGAVLVGVLLLVAAATMLWYLSGLPAAPGESSGA